MRILVLSLLWAALAIPTTLAQTPQAVVVPRGNFPTLQPVTRQPHSQVERQADASLRMETATAIPASRSTARTVESFGPLVTVCSSLALVLALFAGLVWATRKFGAGSAPSRPLPATTLHPLGHTMLDARTKIMLVRCGRRVLVLSQTAGGLTPLSEITDADEVRELIAGCSAEARQAFESTLKELEREPIRRGFTESTDRRLFATA